MGSQLWLLLWKNYLIQRRKVFVTVLEIGLPTLFALILILIRQRVESIPRTNSTSFQAFNIDYLPGNLTTESKTPWKLHYYPKLNVTDRLMDRLINQMGGNITEVIGYDVGDEINCTQDIVAELQNGPEFCDILGAVIFHNFDNDTIPCNISYEIRLSSSPRNAGKQSALNPMKMDTKWQTKFMFPIFQQVSPREQYSKQGGDPGYWREGFLTLQRNLDLSIMQELINDKNISGGDALGDLQISMRRIPYPPYLDDKFVLVLQQQLPFLIMLSFIVVALNIAKDVTYEKEKKLKETMKLMGLSNWKHWLAWFIKYLLFMLISVSIMTALYCVSFGVHGSVIGYIHWSILLVFLIAYSISTICFSFMISVFFNKANSAAAVAGILFFVTYIPYFFLQPRYDTLSLTAKLLFCLISNVAMCFGGQVISMFEGTGSGVQWDTINKGATVDDNFSLLLVIVMLLIDSVIYCLITWYVEAVFPGEHGIPQPWYFPVMGSYWCGHSKTKSEPADGETTPLLSESFDSTSQDSGYFEKEPLGIKPGISIKKLQKTFGKGSTSKLAVSDMTLNIYDGQITALLGHNGAGKTTTMSMLTGFFPPTSGTAKVNGCDIRNNIQGARQSLGLCPQHNTLFDSLTVDEHLVFFAKLKGCSGDQIGNEVERMLMALGLESKQNARSSSLSGGMKRKLSVGIALIGGSKVVILDEPTSGMDPEARRHTWSLLQHYREGRTMLLSTHFMDEADVLGDRIAIMANGVVKCCGTPLFLKNKYGAGYHMVLVKKDGCDVQRITSVIESYVPEARMESDVAAELTYILPHDSKAQFQKLFSHIEEQSEDLGISSYGASVTTMEEVFLRVGEEDGCDWSGRLTRASTGTSDSSINGNHGNSMLGTSNIEGSDAPILVADALQASSRDRNTGSVLYLQQVYSMLTKRILHTMRNLVVTISQLLVPFIFTLLALIVMRTLPSPGDSPRLTLKYSHFGYQDISYSHGVHPDALTHSLAASYAALFKSDPFVHLRNINNQTNYPANDSLEEYLSLAGDRLRSKFVRDYIVAAEFQTEKENKTTAEAHFNNQAYHTPAITLNTLHNTILHHYVNSSYMINAVNFPLPRTVTEQVNDELYGGYQGFMIAFNVMFGMAFLASSFVIFLIKERASKAKHSQFVSGAQSASFWVANFIWDLINYTVPCILLLVLFVAFGIKGYTEGGGLGDVWLLFMMYGWAVLPFMYLLSFLFNVPASGLVWLTMLNILSGIATVLAVEILSIPQLGTEDISKILDWIFITLLPNYCLGMGLQDLYSNYEILKICDNAFIKAICQNTNMTMSCCKDRCGDTCLDYNENYLGWEEGGIGRMLVFLAIQGFGYFAILLLVESHFFQSIWYSAVSYRERRQKIPHGHYQRMMAGSDEVAVVEEDKDVRAEKNRIRDSPLQSHLESNAILLDHISKQYGGLVAVDQVAVGVPQGECFGLLGVNGAGKTSTFKMLTGDEMLTSGSAYLGGFNIGNNMKMVRHCLGYCPQFDALIDQQTGRETLTMYARLHGMKEAQIPMVVQLLLQTLLLGELADKRVSSYSGGNKRKLSTAIALVGNPPVVLLDEPTTGMDPVARRIIWNTLSQLRASGRTLVLTSHSMDECEALCTRIAIMVNGQFKCLGSTQHLKNRFGQGCTILAKVTQADHLDALMQYIEVTFPSSVLKDVHQGMVHYHVTDTSVSWAQLFAVMEEAKERFHLEDYSVSQTTLEQVFINFARAQIPPTERKQGCCVKCGILGSYFFCCGCCGLNSGDEELVSVVQRHPERQEVTT